jgi:drug/metabolite transporter (DMT)-like permease
MMIKTFLILVVGITAMSFAPIFVKFCEDVPAIMIATYRLTIASVILLAVCKFKGTRFKNIEKKDMLLSLLGGLFLAFHFVLWISSLKYTSVSSSIVLGTTNPIFVGIFSYLFLKEKQNIELIFGIALSFLGSAMIAIGDSGIQFVGTGAKNPLIGDGLALASAVVASGYLIVGSKVRARLDVLIYVTLVYTMGAILLILVSIIQGIPFGGYRPSSYIYMVLLAIVPQLIGHTSINWALKHLKTSMIAITILGDPIGATFLAYVLFEESVGTLQMTGILLIFAAIILASRKGRKELAS